MILCSPLWSLVKFRRRIFTFSGVLSLLINRVVHFKGLGRAANDVMGLAMGVEPADNCVLARHVQLGLDFVKFLAHAQQFGLEFLDSFVLLSAQEH